MKTLDQISEEFVVQMMRDLQEMPEEHRRKELIEMFESVDMVQFCKGPILFALSDIMMENLESPLLLGTRIMALIQDGLHPDVKKAMDEVMDVINQSPDKKEGA